MTLFCNLSAPRLFNKNVHRVLPFLEFAIVYTQLCHAGTLYFVLFLRHVGFL